MKRSFVGAKAVGALKRTRSDNREVEVSTEQDQQEASMTAPVIEKSIPELKGIQNFPNVDPSVKELFSFPPKNLPLGGILSCCTENWTKRTSDPKILQTVKGCEMEWEHEFSVLEKKN